MQNIYSIAREDILAIIAAHGGAIVIRRSVGGIGDAVMINPAATALKLQWGANELVVVVCIDYVASIFAMNDAIDYVLVYSPSEISEGVEKRDIRRLLEAGSVIHDLYDPCPAAVYESANSPYYLDIYNFVQPTFRSIIKSRQELFAEACGVEFRRENYNMTTDERYREDVLSLHPSGRYVVYQLRSHDAARDYGLKRGAWLVSKLVKLGRKEDFGVVTFDATESIDVDGVISITASPLEFKYELIKQALLFIGPDSMGVHVRGAFKGKSLALFGPTDPKMRLCYDNSYWMPRHKTLWKKCPRQYCWYTPCKMRFCMQSQSMGVNKVYRRAKQMLLGG